MMVSMLEVSSRLYGALAADAACVGEAEYVIVMVQSASFALIDDAPLGAGAVVSAAVVVPPPQIPVACAQATAECLPSEFVGIVGVEAHPASARIESSMMRFIIISFLKPFIIYSESAFLKPRMTLSVTG